jgi:hypothetical protein
MAAARAGFAVDGARWITPVRRSKSEIRKKPETRNPKPEGQTGLRAVLRFGTRVSDFVPVEFENVRLGSDFRLKDKSLLDGVRLHR